MTDVTALLDAAVATSDPWRGDDTFDVLDPATDEVVRTVPSATPETARQSADAAAAALGPWAASTPRSRAEILRRTFEIMEGEAEAIARVIVAENGKALADARSETHYAADFFRWYSEEAVRLDGSLGRSPSGGNRILTSHKPIGVAALVTPWNFPAAMATRKIAPALAAGCTVVLKPASETPLTALVIADVLRRAGVPEGVVHVLPSAHSSAIVGELLAHPAVRKLSFTGSTEVGKVLLRSAADRVVSASMELGGNAPFVVLPGADVDAAVAGAMLAKMRNGGQACTAANRFIVHESVAEAFVDRFSAAMGSLAMGPGHDERNQLGPVINRAAQRDMQSLVDQALASGGRARTGGAVPVGPGSFYPATVVADVPGDAPVLREEIFGPVAPVSVVGSVDEAVRLANATEVGLAGYVYAGDLAQGLAVAERLDVGMVGLNRGVVSDPAAPFGGVKESGLGREGAEEGILEYTEVQMIATQW
ncbi:NAD-dependent succinate-semialdehyde dehydrogenase [Curtobacterium pusillum]|uniref:NAD-dependent succinate-semialdehyde dehydrogenase n=1 Tax=Curtobacterium pusillum TaxID=69373 RepID=A0ABX2MHJ3_9MICO|nr:NAD-dependent succinate-semialdehyde dehydrogenase [Curtobacterium pusillum]NUU15266.1 NAD-dependent succinate-semialdehyde dehydrogenase [Curtobacterium pusillum]GLK31401.1 NAD-dependent succinate-semialdehyde dehydrogenase [Curtobacterium pusillum]